MASTRRANARAWTNRLLVAVIVAATGAAPTFAQSGSPAKPPETDLDRLNTALRTLTEEAVKAKESGEMPRRQADFARTSGLTIDPSIVGRRLVEPIDRDSFVDAYIRWQLTSFKPELPDLTDREFERMLKDLPKYPENPRADRRLIDTLNRAVAISSQRQGGLLTEAEAAQLSKMLEENAAAESRARRLMTPAREYRDWLEETQGELGARAHLVRLERLASMLAAGWDVEREKRQLEAAFSDAAQDPTLTSEDRQRLISIARRLAGSRRGYIQRAAINEGRIEFDANESAVYDFEINAWARALAGRM